MGTFNRVMGATVMGTFIARVMGARVMGATVMGAVMGAGLLVGCRRAPPPPPAPAATSAKPVDRLAPGEAAPGVETAFDLQLPRGTVIEARFGTTLHAKIPLPPEQVASFVQQQSDGAEAVMGPNGTLFPNLHVKGSDVGHHLRIEVSTAAMGNGTTLVVNRIEERPDPEPLPADEAMKKAGLNPNGGLLDPNHTE